MLDSDLAKLYGVPIKGLMNGVRRNLENDFPLISCFSLPRMS